MSEAAKNTRPHPAPRDRAQQFRDLGTDPYPGRCRARTPIHDVLQSREMTERGAVWIAGRISQIQREVKTWSVTLSDHTGKIELQTRRDSNRPGNLGLLDALRPGDIIETRIKILDEAFRSDDIHILAPNRTAAPALEDGIPSDDILKLRARVMQGVRSFFEDLGYLEVETPALSAAPDPAPHLASFTTDYLGERDRTRLYLPTSPELHMKRLLAAGHERIFQICKFFRNGERTALHNPEFTGLEWYEVYADYRSAMDTVEALIGAVSSEALGQPEIDYQGNRIDLRPPWERLTVREAFRGYAGFDLWSCPDRDRLARTAGDLEIFVGEDDTWEDLFFKILIERIEPRLGRSRPTLLHDYPEPMALLSKRKAEDPSIAERFEVYIGGLELANGFTELNDPEEQRARWETELDVRRGRDPRDRPPLDEDFLRTLDAGTPPAAGAALGLDRLVMLLADCDDIGRVRCFPLKP